MMRRLLSGPRRILAAVAAALAIGMTILGRVDPIQAADEHIRDLAMLLLPAPAPAGPCRSVVVLDIGGGWQRRGGASEADRRERCGRLAEGVRAALAEGACAVGLDVGLGCESSERPCPVDALQTCAPRPGESALLDALRVRPDRVVVPMTAFNSSGPIPPLRPLEAITALGVRAGFVDQERHPREALVHDHRSDSESLPSFALEIARTALSLADSQVRIDDGQLVLGNDRISLRSEDSLATLAVRWRSELKPLPLSAGDLRDRVVLIGAAALPADGDYYDTVLNPRLPGVLLHAQIVGTLLAGGATRRTPTGLNALLLALLTAAVGSTFLRNNLLRSALISMLAGIVMIAGWLSALHLGRELPLVEALILVPLGSLVGLVMRAATAQALQRRQCPVAGAGDPGERGARWSWVRVRSGMVERKARNPVRLMAVHAEADGAYWRELERHLAPLRHQGILRDWHDGIVPPGVERNAEMNRQMEDAEVVLLLLSSDFLADDACEQWMRRALERQETMKAQVVPVVVRPCDWMNTAVGKLKPLPEGGLPVASWDLRDEAWVSVVSGLRVVCATLWSP